MSESSAHLYTHFSSHVSAVEWACECAVLDAVPRVVWEVVWEFAAGAVPSGRHLFHLERLMLRYADAARDWSEPRGFREHAPVTRREVRDALEADAHRQQVARLWHTCVYVRRHALLDAERPNLFFLGPFADHMRRWMLEEFAEQAPHHAWWIAPFFRAFFGVQLARLRAPAAVRAGMCRCGAPLRVEEGLGPYLCVACVAAHEAQWADTAEACAAVALPLLNCDRCDASGLRHLADGLVYDAQTGGGFCYRCIEMGAAPGEERTVAPLRMVWAAPRGRRRPDYRQPRDAAAVEASCTETCA